jgi:hypothetical protein
LLPTTRLRAAAPVVWLRGARRCARLLVIEGLGIDAHRAAVRDIPPDAVADTMQL